MEFMPKGAKIGTGSQRRGAQIKAILPDVNIVPLRGNIDTRLKKIETENLTGVILAAAGMKRMGFAEKITQFLPVETMLPAVGQGALGLQIRKADVDLAKICAPLNDANNRCGNCSRAFISSRSWEADAVCRLRRWANWMDIGFHWKACLPRPTVPRMIREKITAL